MLPPKTLHNTGRPAQGASASGRNPAIDRQTASIMTRHTDHRSSGVSYPLELSPSRAALSIILSALTSRIHHHRTAAWIARTPCRHLNSISATPRGHPTHGVLVAFSDQFFSAPSRVPAKNDFYFSPSATAVSNPCQRCHNGRPARCHLKVARCHLSGCNCVASLRSGTTPVCCLSRLRTGAAAAGCPGFLARAIL